MIFISESTIHAIPVGDDSSHIVRVIQETTAEIDDLGSVPGVQRSEVNNEEVNPMAEIPKGMPISPVSNT